MSTARLSAIGVGGLLFPCLTGCFFFADLLNPDVLSTLGLASIVAPPGRTVLAYNNTTDFTAQFAVAVSDSTTDPTSNARLIANPNVDSGESVANVLDCPIGVITPGAPSEDFATGTVAAIVLTGDNAVEVTYNGAPLVFGQDFFCGDVVEVRLLQQTTIDGDTQQQQFFIIMRVIPGR